MVYRKHRTSTTSTVDTTINIEDSPIDNEEEKENNDNNTIWTPEMELTFLHAITKFKPVGIHKHFRMINLQRYFNSNSSKKLSTQELWNKFTELYNQEALDEQANRYNQDLFENLSTKKRKISSPEPTNLTEFLLPSEDFDTLISEQRKATSPISSNSPSHSSETPETMTSPAPTPSTTTTATTTTTTTTKKNRGRSSRASVSQSDEKISKAQSLYISGTRRTTRARAANSPSIKRKR
ncbi:CT20-domain-containing protein [Anaeromyces robustus]|uniref:CT20-domain-containing protein n=1 Tax=Anaeromyces robustus TaxID=1754192 RepID=A0A1Y1XCI9_9FUNG|nr:CT20-domain-containing protein [Anaeromyces robustus]|eukprot:ORX83448.1 CT20-domain-containing protein [Anaeromyces robustus]